MSSSTVCDGKTQPEGFTHDAEAGAQHEVFITTDSRTAWHVMIGVVVPATGPAPSATGEPTAARSPLGRPDEAILVRPIGASWTTPNSLEVTRFDPADQSSDVIATIPGSVVPAGKWISTDAKPVVSATGWLAIPIRPGPDATDTESAIVFVDLLDPTAPPKSIVGPQSGSWNGDMFAANSADGVQIYDPATGSLGIAPVTDPAVQIATNKNNDFDPIWTTAPNSRFVARRDIGEWGVVSVDGSFSATTDLPPVYQRTGRERLTGADAHSFVPACTGSGSTIEARCTMVETDATGTPIATRVGTPDYAYLADFAWAANGRDAWLLFDDGAEGGSGATRRRHRIALPLATGRRPDGVLQAPARRRELRHPRCRSPGAGRWPADHRHRFEEQLAPGIRRDVRRRLLRRERGAGCDVLVRGLGRPATGLRPGLTRRLC